MSKELQFLEEVLGKPIMNMEQDQECAAYCGYNFWFDSYQIKYRKAKITPKKTGCFVALWKRNTKGKTVPFQASDNFDFYLIEVEENENKGIFVFPKEYLIKHKIISADTEGKRGFRLYPSWNIVENKQALKTQLWQLTYFINLNNTQNNIQNQIANIFDLHP